MRFFDRKKEIEELRLAKTLSLSNAQFTVVTGRRRIGKTTLIRKAYEDDCYLYFFVARKSEKELCAGFSREIEQKLNLPILGFPDSFADIFEFLLKLSINQPLTLFIDEFQEFNKINESIFSDMQRLWDQYHTEARINLIVCGSIYSMMSKIFMDKKEPLYNRENRFMKVKPFPPSVIKEIMEFYNPSYSKDDLLALYSYTGGVAKYIQLLMDSNAFTNDAMIKAMINEGSTFIGEGKAILIEEFGKEYGTYFSILSAISIGKTSRSEIENAVGKEIGGYLTRLEEDYEIIKKNNPIFEKNKRKNVRYFIRDNFFQFWFRFIFRYSYMIEIEAYDSLREIISRNYETFSGKIMEKYFKELLIESRGYTRIGSWWDRKGENEIDIIAENEISKKLVFIEVKRKKENYKEDILRRKAEAFFETTGDFQDYAIAYKGVSLKDM